MDTTQDNSSTLPAKRGRGRPPKLNQTPTMLSNSTSRKPRKPKTRKTGPKTTFRSSYCQRATKIMAQGHSEAQVAMSLGVTTGCLSKWKRKFPELDEAIKEGAKLADTQVQKSLFKRATGYSHRDEYISQYRGEIVRAKTIKHYAPDTQALQFWLKNRVPEQWQDRVQVESEGIAGFLAAMGGHSLASGPANSTDRKAIECQVVDSLPPGEQEPAKQVDDTAVDGS